MNLVFPALSSQIKNPHSNPPIIYYLDSGLHTATHNKSHYYHIVWRYSLVVRTGGFDSSRNLLTQVRSLLVPLRVDCLFQKTIMHYDVRVLRHMAITSFTRMSELVKEAGLRSADASRMGSNPIPSKEFGASFQKAPGDHTIRFLFSSNST